jgi:hypothetical protein
MCFCLIRRNAKRGRSARISQIKSPDIAVALKQGDRIHFAAVHEPLLALGGHSNRAAECPFLNQSGHLASAYFLSTPVSCYDPSLSFGAASKARRRHW